MNPWTCEYWDQYLYHVQFQSFRIFLKWKIYQIFLHLVWFSQITTFTLITAHLMFLLLNNDKLFNDSKINFAQKRHISWAVGLILNPLIIIWHDCNMWPMLLNETLLCTWSKLNFWYTGCPNKMLTPFDSGFLYFSKNNNTWLLYNMYQE